MLGKYTLTKIVVAAKFKDSISQNMTNVTALQQLMLKELVNFIQLNQTQLLRFGIYQKNQQS